MEESANKVIFVDTICTGGTLTDVPLNVPAKDKKSSRLQKVMVYGRVKGRSTAIDITESVTDGKLTWSPLAMLTSMRKASADKVEKKTLKQEIKDIDQAQWRIIAVYIRYGVMKVKRAAPGGEGWVIDHFDRQAVRHYLDRFDKAFAESGVAWPHTFFNDSYEVYGANWTPTLFDEFQKRRGYDLRQHLPELLGKVDDGNKVLADYSSAT